MSFSECCYAECRYAECRYAECRYAECRGALSVLVFAIVLKNVKDQTKWDFKLGCFHFLQWHLHVRFDSAILGMLRSYLQTIDQAGNAYQGQILQLFTKIGKLRT